MPKYKRKEPKILTSTFHHDRAKLISRKGSIAPPDRPSSDPLREAAKAVWKPLFPKGSPLDVITPLDRIAFTRLGNGCEALVKGFLKIHLSLTYRERDPRTFWPIEAHGEPWPWPGKAGLSQVGALPAGWMLRCLLPSLSVWRSRALFYPLH